MKMTGAEAWQHLAVVWDNAKSDDRPHAPYGVVVGGVERYSLCSCLYQLKEDGCISENVYRTEYRRLHLIYDIPEGELYWWGHDQDGARDRAAACRALSKLAKMMVEW